MLLPILTAPHPILAAKAREVRPDEFGPELSALLSNMAETMYASDGIGLAAPQVGDSRRILVVDPFQEGTFSRFINPVIVGKSITTVDMKEGCLSVPGLNVSVARSTAIDLSWQDETGASHHESFAGMIAIVLQHEIDHLDGTVLLDRASNFARSRYLKALRRN